MANMTTSSNSANLHLYYEKKLLQTLEPRLVFYQLGKKQKLPKGMGKQVKWLRYSAIAGSTTALTEGAPPSELSVSTSNVTATIAQYGEFAKVTDMLSDTAIDPVLENLAERFGRASAKVIEKLIIAELDSGAAVQRVNNRANDAAIVAGDVLNHKELIEAKIRMQSDYIDAHESGDFVAVIHPLAQFDLQVDTQTGAWLDIQKSVDNKPLLNGEIGRMYGMRFLTSDHCTTEADAGAGGTVDVLSNYVVGEEAFGVVELGGDSVKMFRKGLGSAGTADPLDQISTVGYKIHGFAAKYLDSGSKRVTRIKCSSALGDNA